MQTCMKVLEHQWVFKGRIVQDRQLTSLVVLQGFQCCSSCRAMAPGLLTMVVMCLSIPVQVTRSSILDTQPVETALNAAAAAEKKKPGRCKEVVKVYAALAVMRQAAQALTQYGIRYAHLYLRHNLEALPVLKK